MKQFPSRGQQDCFTCHRAALRAEPLARNDANLNSQIFAGGRLTAVAAPGILFPVRSREGAI